MKLSIAIATTLLSFTLACGGKSKPADTTSTGGGGDEPAGKMAGGCCCEFIEETGEGDEMAENQVRRMMSGQECEQNTGTCVAAADQLECEAEATPPTE